MLEEFETTPGMDKFFTRLLMLKGSLKIMEDRISSINSDIGYINVELNEIIKEKK